MILLALLIVLCGHEAQAFYNASTGRWLSRDPIEEQGGINLYGALMNDACNGVDYLGEYEVDFHFYAIYYLARAKCYNHHNAYNLAYESQAVDDRSSTDPLRLGFEAAYGNEGAATRLANYHFWRSSKTAGTRRNPSDLAALIGVGYYSLGPMLHTFADSYAHEGFTAWPVRSINYRTGSARGYALNFVGHVDAPEGGHAPDYPYNDVAKALEAATRIFQLLSDRSCCSSTRPLLLSTVQDDLRKGFSYRSDLDNRVSYFQSIIEHRFGSSVEYRFIY